MNISPQINNFSITMNKTDDVYIPDIGDIYIDEHNQTWKVENFYKDNRVLLDRHCEVYIIEFECTNSDGSYAPNELYEYKIDIDEEANDSIEIYGTLEGSKTELLSKGFGTIVINDKKKSWVCRLFNGKVLDIAIGPLVGDYSAFYCAQLYRTISITSKTMPVDLILNTLVEMIGKLQNENNDM